MLKFLRVNIEKLAIWAFVMNLIVILQGAFVRATGSGAGCGSHWPTCHGEVIPLDFNVQMAIEYSHRGLSGIVLLLGAWLLLRGWQLRREKPGFFWFTAAAAVLIIIEALLGAGTVLFELTGDNVSTARGLMVASHLVNSMLLIGALSGVLVYSRRQTPRWPLNLAAQPALTTVFGLGLLLMLIVMFTGGIAAMGNTMFPAATLAEGVAMDFDPDSHPLVRLRTLHPIIAISVGVYLFLALGFARQRKPVVEAQRMSQVLYGTYLAQLGVGFVNWILNAPTFMQLVHLGVAVAVFAAFSAVAFITLGYPLPQRAPAVQPGATKLENLQS